MKNKINAKIVADSISPQGHRITSYILTYPRSIHAEVMTHRMFSRNAASSRAIPLNKMIKMIKDDPFIPIAWQKGHKGMQGNEYIKNVHLIKILENKWKIAAKSAIDFAKDLNKISCDPYPLTVDEVFTDFEEEEDISITKQITNRLLEPFMWYTNLVTATEYDNFFELRCPKYKVPGTNTMSSNIYRSKKDAIKDYPSMINLSELDWIKLSISGAEIHIQALAEAMWDVRNESTPVKLKAGEWHIPFGDRIYSEDNIETVLRKQLNVQWVTAEGHDEELDKLAIKIASARCARLSYMTFDGEIDYEKDIKLHDTLLANRHMSCFEHCAKVMSDEEYYSFIKGEVKTSSDEWGIINHAEYGKIFKNGTELDFISKDKKYGWCNNLKGFIPYRYIVENENK